MKSGKRRLLNAQGHTHPRSPPVTTPSRELNVSTLAKVVASSVTPIYFPLTPDHHLLHVVSLNIIRAVLTNYLIVTSVPLSTSDFCSAKRVFAPSHHSHDHGIVNELPAALRPTKLQQQIPHVGWIDLFPSPKLRDNLILAVEKLDQEELLFDLLGMTMNHLCGGTDYDAGNGGSTSEVESWIGEPGLVSWSDPWDIGGWEVSDRFVRKWGGLLRGCEDVVRAANKWRDRRGDEALVVEV